MAEKVLTPGEIARFLGVDPRTVRKWIAIGHMRARRVTTKNGAIRYYVRRSEIEKSEARSPGMRESR